MMMMMMILCCRRGDMLEVQDCHPYIQTAQDEREVILMAPKEEKVKLIMFAVFVTKRSKKYHTK